MDFITSYFKQVASGRSILSAVRENCAYCCLESSESSTPVGPWVAGVTV